MSTPEPLLLREGRFARLEAIRWWNQPLLARTRILVIGAGALGNEVVKNLAMLGIGHLVIADMDRIEMHNLTRSILFREGDEGRYKAEVAAAAARAIYPQIQASAAVGNVLADLGLGYFRWADLVIGALDNREARVFVNSASARTGRAWIDGGIDVLQGIVRGFAPPATACYECTMGQADWDLLNRRRSCSLLARNAAASAGTPTTPTTASIIAAVQVQEVIKRLHGMEGLFGSGLVFDGMRHSSFTVEYQKLPECPWHDPAPEIVPIDVTSAVTFAELWEHAARKLGTVDALDLSREIVVSARCAACGETRPVCRVPDAVSPQDILCSRCGAERVPEFTHSLQAGSPLLARTVAELGLPRWDIVFARSGERVIGFEIAGDNPLPSQAPSIAEAAHV